MKTIILGIIYVILLWLRDVPYTPWEGAGVYEGDNMSKYIMARPKLQSILFYLYFYI